METPRAWAKLEEAVFFLDHLRREHDAVTTSSPTTFGYYLAAFLNAAYGLTEALEREAKIAIKRTKGTPGKRDVHRWKERFPDGLSTEDRGVWVFFEAQRGADVHTTGVQMLSEDNPVTPSDELPGLEHHPHLPLYRVLSTWYPGMAVPRWTRAWHDAPLHLFEIEGERRGAVEACADYLVLLRRFLDEFHASALARGGP